MDSVQIERLGNNTKRSANFFAIVRHGERIDYTAEGKKQDYPNMLDPPLSKMGFSQADRTGEFFQTFCPMKSDIDTSEDNQNNEKDKFKIGFDQIIIESSPFIRCI